METFGCMGLIVGIVIMGGSAFWLWALSLETIENGDPSWDPSEWAEPGEKIGCNILAVIIRRPIASLIPVIVFLLGLGLFVLCWRALPTDEMVRLTPAPGLLF